MPKVIPLLGSGSTLVWKKGEIRWQMWHNIMSMNQSNCLRYIFGIVGGKSNIANTRLSKSHELNIVTSKIDLS